MSFFDDQGLLNDLFHYAIRPKVERIGARNTLALELKIGSDKVELVKDLPWSNLVIFNQRGHHIESRTLREYFEQDAGGQWYPEQKQDVTQDD